MASRKNREHKLRMKKRGETIAKKRILSKLKTKSSKGVLHVWKAKPYKQSTTKRRYNKSKR